VRTLIFLVIIFIPSVAQGQTFQVNDREPGHENDQMIVEPVRICQADLSCITFDETPRPERAQPDQSPIVSAPSGGIRILAGAEGGSSFGNLFAGVRVGVEWPVTRRLEIDIRDTFSPLEEHIALGRGWANQVEGGGIIWITRSIGGNGYVEHSSYHVSINKSAEYASAGITLRKSFQTLPIRFGFDYLREFNNGIDATGTESAHLQAGRYNMDMRVACHLNFCIRVAFDFKVGHVLTQSNPVCDGSFGGPITCRRTGATSGAFTGSVSVEFPRRQAIENFTF
jgi:hypothetical protein